MTAIVPRGGAPARRWLMAMVASLLLLAVALRPTVAFADETGAGHHDDGRKIIFGLTAKQIAIAAGVGALVGGTGALVASGGVSAGTGLGVVAAVYVGHLLVEAVVVGGVYYLWPERPKPEEAAGVPIAHNEQRVPGLSLALATRQVTP